MANEIKLPQLGQTMEEGTIVNCLVKVGDEVAYKLFEPMAGEELKGVSRV